MKPTREKAGKSPTASDKRVRLDVDERRAQLVELGLGQFGSRPYDEVSIDQLAKAAGISKGLLYHYFPTKRAFYVACVRVAAAQLLARVDDIATDVPPLERLMRGLDSYLDYVRAHGRAFATLLRSGVGADVEIAAIVDRTRATLLERLTSGLDDLFPRRGVAASPLLAIALVGWIGLAEATSIAWVEACVESSRPPTKKKATASRAPPPTRAEVRDLLTKLLLAILESVHVSETPG